MTEISRDESEQASAENKNTEKMYRNTRNNNNDRGERILDLLMMTFLALWQRLYRNIDRLCTEFKLYELFDVIGKFLAKHPFLALFISGMIFVLSLPFLIFTLFALTTAVLTFLGIVMVEGTLITVASILLFGCFGCVLVILLFFGGVILAGYLGFIRVYDLLDNTCNQKAAIARFLNRHTTGHSHVQNVSNEN